MKVRSAIITMVVGVTVLALSLPAAAEEQERNLEFTPYILANATSHAEIGTEGGLILAVGRSSARLVSIASLAYQFPEEGFTATGQMGVGWFSHHTHTHALLTLGAALNFHQEAHVNLLGQLEFIRMTTGGFFGELRFETEPPYFRSEPHGENRAHGRVGVGFLLSETRRLLLVPFLEGGCAHLPSCTFFGGGGALLLASL